MPSVRGVAQQTSLDNIATPHLFHTCLRLFSHEYSRKQLHAGTPPQFRHFIPAIFWVKGVANGFPPEAINQEMSTKLPRDLPLDFRKWLSLCAKAQI